MSKLRLAKGQMIIEVVVAFTITVIALVGLLQLSRRSVGSAGGSGRISAATAYANAGIDWITNEKNVNGWSGPSGLRNKCIPKEPSLTCDETKYCLNTLAWTPGACADTILNTEFYRNLILTMFTEGTTRVLKAKVVVSWVEGNRPDSVTRTFEFVEN